MYELSITRETHVSSGKPYAGWSTPELYPKWFCPKPWYVSDVKMDLRPGGSGEKTFNGPDGEVFINRSVYLEIVPNEKLVFTDAFTGDWQPNPELMFVFLAGGLMVLLHLAPPPPPFPEGSAPAHFMAAFATTGYLKFVKCFEVIGGLLIAFPKTRRAGLLVLGPIIINILAFHGFLMHGEGLFSPMLLVIVALTPFLVWLERAAFCAFVFQRGEQIPTHQ